MSTNSVADRGIWWACDGCWGLLLGRVAMVCSQSCWRCCSDR